MGYKNNTKEYERILKAYRNDVYRIALLKMKNANEAEDIFQNVFIKLFTCDTAFESDAHIKAWLLKVTVNECINALKSSWNSKVISNVYEYKDTESDDKSISISDRISNQNNNTYTSDSSPTPLNTGTYKEFDIDSMYVWDTVASLPQKYRDVIYLFYHEQYSADEIASILGISSVNVRTRLKRARIILKKEVSDYEF